jgi:quercetin dioxygenase-like cupin family protein
VRFDLDIGPQYAKTPSPYKQWQRYEGIPVHEGSFVEDLHTAEVAPWPRIGQRAAFVNLADQEHDDGWLIEIAPGGQTEPLHHFFESTVYVVEGRGATNVWNLDGPKRVVEWQRGSLFSPPLNAHYQHYNLDGSQPARLFCVTNGPQVINIYRSVDALFENTYVFSDRYAGESDYFSDRGEWVTNTWKTNFVPDLRTFALNEATGDRRGAGATTAMFNLSNNQMAAHCSEFPPGTYKLGHRHGVGAHVIILGGEGYSLLWFEGDKERRRVDWRSGTLISPKDNEFHQHFNVSPGAARYFAMRLGNLDPNKPAVGQGWNTEREVLGIPYEEEDPEIYYLYVAECA